MNVDEWFGGESRETNETDRRSNGPVPIKCEENECRLVLRQSQICLDNLNRRRCIAHRASACCLPVFLGHARQPAISRSAFTVRQLLVVATVVIPGEVGDQ